MKNLRTRSPFRPALRSALVLLSLLTVARGAAAQDSAQDLGAELDRMFDWTSSSTPGCALAVALDGELIVHRAYGSADLEREVPLTTDSLFDVGSVVKQFVAAAVLLLVDEERLDLGDDIREHFPELAELEHTITVEHLLTHTSGVRDWTALKRLSNEDEDALTLVLRQRGLNFAPGDEWSYSNSGYVLLKELVARITETPFSDFVNARLFEPLGMEASVYATDSSAGHEGLVIAYEPEGSGWRPDVLVGNERGGGGALLSTVGDLILWNEALADEALGAFVSAKLEEPARLNNGRELSYAHGVGLVTSRVGRVIWHTGSAAAYKALLCRYSDHGLSIAILSNAGDSMDRMGLVQKTLELLVPATDTPRPDASASREAAVPSVDLGSRAGLYFEVRTGGLLRLIPQGGRLRVAGGPALVAVDEDRFRVEEPTLAFLSDDAFELEFVSSDRFELVSMEGQRTPYRRAQAGTPDAAELEALVGRYASDEVGAYLDVVVEGEGLSICLNEGQILLFAKADADVFQFGPLLVHFRRGGDDAVTALDLSNPLLRRVPFRRLDDTASGGR